MNKYIDRYISDMNREFYYNLCNKKYIKSKKLTALTVSNGIVVPPKNPRYYKGETEGLFGTGGVVDDKYNYVTISAQLAKNMNARISSIEKFDEKYDIVHEKVIYMNFFIKQWGHYLIDVIGRLWYALKNIDIKIVYTCYQGEINKIEGNYLELLELMGIDKNRIILINKPTKFDEVIVPEMSIYPGDYYTKEYVEMFDIIVKNADIGEIEKNKKVYCSRMNFGKNNKKEFGEDIIEKNLLDNNFVPVYMEKLTLKEQIQLINNSEIIIMTCGSLSHNLLFSRNKNSIYIFNKTYRLNLHQFLVNEISGGEACFIDAYVSPLPILYGYGPFIIRYTKEFANFMADNDFEATCKISNVPILLRIKYYFIYLISYRKFIFGFKKIQESSSGEYELSFKKIRQNYILYLKNNR